MKNYLKKFSVVFAMTLVSVCLLLPTSSAMATPPIVSGYGGLKSEYNLSIDGNLSTCTKLNNQSIGYQFRFAKGVKNLELTASADKGEVPSYQFWGDGVDSKAIELKLEETPKTISIPVPDNAIGFIVCTNPNPSGKNFYVYEVNLKIVNAQTISLNKTTDSLPIGQVDNLSASVAPDNTTNKSVTWDSSDISVATVDATGKITGIKEGKTTITATTTDGSNLSATCIVTVTPKPVVPTPQPTEQETIVNTAYAKGDNIKNASGGVSIIFNGEPDTTLSVVKTADVKSVWVGDTFTYTIVVTNTGSKTAKAVVINDSAPNHIDFNVSGITTTQGKVDPSSTSKNIIVNVGDIPPSGTVTIKVPATVIR